MSWRCGVTHEAKPLTIERYKRMPRFRGRSPLSRALVSDSPQRRMVTLRLGAIGTARNTSCITVRSHAKSKLDGRSFQRK
jgi:hypothetical protein